MGWAGVTPYSLLDADLASATDPATPNDCASRAKTLSQLPLIEIDAGYWQRAGELRAKVLAKRRKARLGDALTAQNCVDRGSSLLTREGDFRAFAAAGALDLVV